MAAVALHLPCELRAALQHLGFSTASLLLPLQHSAERLAMQQVGEEARGLVAGVGHWQWYCWQQSLAAAPANEASGTPSRLPGHWQQQPELVPSWWVPPVGRVHPGRIILQAGEIY